MRSSLLLAALATFVAAPDLAAADCAAEVDQLASRYQVAADLPRTTPPPADARGEVPATPESRGVPPEALQESGGVIAPPNEGRTRVIEPPVSSGSPMPTTPNLPPQTADRPVTKDTEMSAAKRTQLQSLLTAAKAAASQQREAECFQQLGEARALTESLPQQ
jgi:hypothetical protein